MVRRGVGLAMAVLAASPVAGQEYTNDVPEAPVLVGPLYMSPRFEIRDIGIDSNVFNETEPTEDFTATLAAGLEAEALFGSTRTTLTSGSEYLWFQDVVEERAVNSALGGRFEMLAPRLNPWVQLDFIRTRARPNDEIDRRATRQQPSVEAGLGVAVGSRTRVAFSARRSTPTFGAGEVVSVLLPAGPMDGGGDLDPISLLQFEESLARQLNRTTDRFMASYQMALTPLTTWHLETSVRRDSFEQSFFRDATDLRVMSRFELDATALLGGSIGIGAARFVPSDSRLPGYTGLVADGGVSLTLLEATLLAVTVRRDTEYSFEPLVPYYVDTNVGLTLTRRLFGPVEVVVGGSRHRMNYRALAGGASDRRDRVTSLRLGFGYVLGDAVRLGVDFERWERRSTTRPDRHYDRDRLYTSLTYVL